jgi:hypothetical protein
MGIFVNADRVLDRGAATSLLLKACETNGYLGEHGPRHCVQVIECGFKSRIAQSPLPILTERGR